MGHHVYGYHRAKGYNRTVDGLTLHFDEELLPIDSIEYEHHDLMVQEGQSIANAMWSCLPTGTMEALIAALQSKFKALYAELEE